MDWTDIFGYVMLFLFGLVVGRVWGRASAGAGGGNMLTSHMYTPTTLTDCVPHTPAAADAALEAEIRQIAATGNFLHAIKVYQQRTGCGLREARDAIARICGI